MKTMRTFALLLSAAACMWLTASTVRGQVDPNRSPAAESDQAAIEQAQALLESGKVDAAIDALKAVTKTELNQQRINHLLGWAYYQKRDHVRAVEHLSAALRQDDRGSRQHKQAVQLLALSHYLLGHIKEAIPYLEQVAVWAPDDVEMAYTLGLSYIQVHDADRARESFARMFAVPPSSAAAYLINAQMMIRQQFEEFAEKELQKALDLDPKLPQANYLLGELAVYRANLERGVELLRKEISINPGFAMAYYRLGETYTRQLKWNESIPPLQKSIWLNPFFSGPYIVLGKVYMKKGELANAESMLRRALAMDPNNFSGHHLLAQVLQQANRIPESRKEFEIAERLRTSADK